MDYYLIGLYKLINFMNMKSFFLKILDRGPVSVTLAVVLSVLFVTGLVSAATTISTSVVTGGDIYASSTAEIDLGVTAPSFDSITGVLSLGVTNASAIKIGATAIKVGIATTTPLWILNPFSATASQLALSNGAGISQWALRNAGGNFYLASTTAAGTATTSTSALTVIGATGKTGVATSSPFATLSVQGVEGTIPFAISTSTRTGAGMPVFEVDSKGHILVSGATPTVSGCGATTPAVSGNDTAGKVTTGSTGATSCTVTFANAYAVAPSCTLSGGPGTGSLLYSAIYSSTTAAQFSFMASSTAADASPLMTSWVISYLCIGTQ